MAPAHAHASCKENDHANPPSSSSVAMSMSKSKNVGTYTRNRAKPVSTLSSISGNTTNMSTPMLATPSNSNSVTMMRDLKSPFLAGGGGSSNTRGDNSDRKLTSSVVSGASRQTRRKHHNKKHALVGSSHKQEEVSGNRRYSWVGRQLSYRPSTAAYPRKALPKTNLAQRQQEEYQRTMAEARAYFEDIDKEVLLEESPQKHAADNNDEPTVEEQSPLPPIQLASGRKVTREWVNSLPALEELEPINLETLVEDEGDGDGDDASTNTDEKDDVAAPLPVTRPSVAALGRRSSILLPPAMRKPSRGSLPRMSIMPSDATAAQRSTGSRGSARPRSSIVAACTSVAAERARHSSLAMPTLAEDEDAVTEPIEAVPTAVDPEEDGVADSLDTNLRALLNDCDQTGVKCEDDLPSMADVIDEFAPLPAALPVGGLGRKKKAAAAPPRLRKIGEGTFGEAFKDASGKVYKVVPMGGTVLVNGEEQKPVAELRAEAVVALRLSHLGGDGKSASYTCPFYAKTHAVRVCRGRYDDSLLAEWCRWDKENESENDRPDFFPEDQLFAVFIVADGGTDLERYRFRSYDEAIAVLFQASLALACGEGACEFEHRDLHWGNLLIAPAENELGPVMLNGAPVEIETSASCVKVTLIDFTLSRVVTPDGGVAFCDLEGDPALFDGPTGDTQADTYRRMRKAIPLETVCLMEEVEEEEEEEEDGDKTKAPKRTEMVTRRVRDWSKHVPSTNALWLHYLVDCVMNQKSGPGGLALNSEQTKVLRGFRKRSLRYESASEAVWDEAFRGLWHV